ncbi:MAG: glycosyltransferase [Candidatus Sedimenticola sp. (ex Thyasira tokunagai)]
MNIDKKNLTITPSVPVWLDGEDYVFDRKFYDGMLLYVKEWTGNVNCVMSLTEDSLPPFGCVRQKQEDLPFGLSLLKDNARISDKHIKGADVVLASGDSFEQFHVSGLCRRHGVKCVYIIEYIPETRYQIVNLGRASRVVKLYRCLYIWRGERRRRKAFQLADGIQANGTASNFYYCREDKSCLLYFDSRVYSEQIINHATLNKRLSTLSHRRPLRLAFSGRLIRMKGAESLIRLAELLQTNGVEFTMSIYGSGDLEAEMRFDTERKQLGDHVKMKGAVDFYNELLPDIKENVDLYIVLHKQSDPSCTYLETLSCGIPIVGYKNKAFSGLLDMDDIGWGKEVGDIEGIAEIIKCLDHNREEIAEKSVRSMEFSRSHDFRTTFKRRIDHLKQL